MRRPETPVGSAEPWPVAHERELAPGAHVVAVRRGYTHHGIYVGAGRIVHYAGLSRSWRCGPVEEISLAEFADGQSVAIKRDRPAHYPADVVVARARARLGEDRYSIATNNCEHFCAWCRRGEHRSEQIDRLLAWPSAIVRALALSLISARSAVRGHLQRRRETSVVVGWRTRVARVGSVQQPACPSFE